MSDSVKTLMPEVEVNGRVMRPWSLGQIAKASPAIVRMMRRARENGLDLNKVFAAGYKVDQVLVAEIILLSLDDVIDIMAVTYKEPREKLEDVAPGDALTFVFAVFELNGDYLKNSLAPAMARFVATADQTGAGI